MSIIEWGTTLGIIVVAVYGLIRITYPLVNNQWQLKDVYATMHLKRSYQRGEISQEAYQAMKEMHSRRGYCDYCRAFHHAA